MIKNYRDKLPIFEFHSLQKFSDDLDHGVLSRNGGVSKKPFDSLNVSLTIDDRTEDVLQNRKIICRSFGIEEKNLISAHQTHSKNVLVVDEEVLKNHETNRDIENIDGFITNIPEVALMIKVADCQAIFLFDPVTKVVAALHAGWRGLMQDISGTAISLMKKKFKVKPEHLVATISPSLGPCCSFFSEPEKELSSDFKPYIQNNNTVDLWRFSTDQLIYRGVQPDHIELARVCTMCGGGGKFYSFRADRGVTGRFGALIYLKKPSVQYSS